MKQKNVSYKRLKDCLQTRYLDFSHFLENLYVHPPFAKPKLSQPSVLEPKVRKSHVHTGMVSISAANCSHCDHDGIRRSVVPFDALLPNSVARLPLFLISKVPKSEPVSLNPLDLKKKIPNRSYVSRLYFSRKSNQQHGLQCPKMLMLETLSFADGALSGTVTAIRTFEDQPDEVDIEMEVEGKSKKHQPPPPEALFLTPRMKEILLLV